MEKRYSIVVAYSHSKDIRAKILEQTIISAGFASIRSDARKLIKKSIVDIDLTNPYFIFIDDFNFTRNEVVTNRLIKLALLGTPVFVSAKTVPNSVRQFCHIVD